VRKLLINKIATNYTEFRNAHYYYNSAREGMFDLFENMINEGLIEKLFLPGYIGWSPKEGSGIFDPINNLKGLEIEYYKLNEDLSVNFQDITKKIENIGEEKFAVLIVNYFGFTEPCMEEISIIVHGKSGWIVEDNAHGFFTYQMMPNRYSDATFFSLHKMFPLKDGGSLYIKNKSLKDLHYKGVDLCSFKHNPWEFDIQEISAIRIENYKIIEKLINQKDVNNYFVPLKTFLDTNIVPQTFPILIKVGDRNKIYELMNNEGYGVVSLYHTLIEPLMFEDYNESIKISKCILNLPVHQDTDSNEYSGMIDMLINFCKETM